MTTNDSDHLCSENGKKGGDAEGIILALAIWIFLPNGYDDVADVQGINADIPKGADEKLWRDFAVKTGRMRGVDVKGRKGAHWRMYILSRHSIPSSLSFSRVIDSSLREFSHGIVGENS